MFTEIQDMPGEIFDICPNTGMFLFPGQSPLTEEEIAEMWDDEGENHALDSAWHDAHM